MVNIELVIILGCLGILIGAAIYLGIQRLQEMGKEPKKEESKPQKGEKNAKIHQ